MRALVVAVVVLWAVPAAGDPPAAAPTPMPKLVPAPAPAPCASAECVRACETRRDIAACARAAELFWQGRGGHAHDPARSFRYATRACDANHAYACALLGLHYQDGIGGPYDPKLAQAAYLKACKAGAGLGCFNLATMYAGAHGIDADSTKQVEYTTQAYGHWRDACLGNEPKWCTNAAFLLRRLDSAASRASALELDQRACDRGITVGCVQVVLAKRASGALTRDAAIRELDKLCRAGEPDACGSLVPLLDPSDGPPAAPGDGKRAVEAAVRACDLGDRPSCNVAGIFYGMGRHVAKDQPTATRYFTRACDRGESFACVVLAEDELLAMRIREGAAFALRACHMGDAKGCYTYARTIRNRDPAAFTRAATDGCRMGSADACRLLVEIDAELPSIPAKHRRQLYQEACDAKNAAACKRLATLPPP